MEVRGVHIKIENLAFRYRAKGATVFEQVNLEAEPGESIIIIGRSGCGKSTLLHVLAGLLRPLTGRVTYDGVEVREPSPRWVMMFQAPHLFPWMRVSQNVGIGLRFARWPEKKIRARVAEVLELVDLQDYANNNVQDLSGGQQQRVALARSLVMEPELLLLDEPFSALDAFTRSSLQRDVRSIAKQIGVNVVMVTHDIDEAVLMGDRALIMSGSPGRIYSDIEVDLPDPRDREDPTVQKMRTRLMRAFEEAEGRMRADRAEAEPEASQQPEEEGGDVVAATSANSGKGPTEPRIVSSASPAGKPS